jgi:hypothetical protein
MKREKDTYVKKFRNITVKTSDGSTLRGKINIGLNDRVSDVFTKTENPFVVLCDVEQRDLAGKVLFVNKRNIVWVEPED